MSPSRRELSTNPHEGPCGQLLVLDASVPAQRRLWLALWDEWPTQEIAAHPGYVELFARDVDRVLCATMRLDGGFVLYPFILRPLAAEPWTGDDEDTWDLSTPYGYGGPFRWSIADSAAQHYWDQLEGWLRGRRVVCSFARLSLFMDELLPFPGRLEHIAPNVVRELTLTHDELWMDYDHKVRKNVNRARASGLTVDIDATGGRLDEFSRLYRHTLQRRDASTRYYFDRSFFEAIADELRGHYAFFYVRKGRELLSAELVLISQTRVYSFLGGTQASAFALRPNDLLKHEVIGWAQDLGKTQFVLGGGYEPGDGIFRYKRSFAPHGELPFFVGTCIHDHETFDRLNRSSSRHRAAERPDSLALPAYFPPYRG